MMSKKDLNDENIMKVLLWYTFSGYESIAKVATQTIVLLEKHPECFQKAKEEQEEIVKRRSSPDAGLTFSEIGQMKYVGNVRSNSPFTKTITVIFFLIKFKNITHFDYYLTCTLIIASTDISFNTER
ncbi:hypothetical protein HAX54_005679 [Datura stramonium]|uniref:Cytochrome P450 n=1 Tax=Datura stramonium TaxID=4076 RepID=A0ABS8T971_DATST|nr:hypothetical protein [Datura stramonium]